MEFANAPLGAGHGYGFTDTKRYSKGLELDNESVGGFLTMDDLLDFSNEDIGGPIEEGYFPNGPLATTAETVSSVAHADARSSQWPNVFLSDGPSELCVPCDDLAELEWLSNFVESSFSSRDACPTVFNSGVNSSYDEQEKSREGNKEFHSSSPISVLESSLCSGKFSSFSPEVPVPARARSKRSRSGVCFWNTSIFPADTSASFVESSSTSTITANTFFSPDSDAFIVEQGGAESSSSQKKCKSNPRKGHDATQTRRCLHCATQRTPQWRAGPMGPKTLCNACGVRYKSGRLLPEYRPAASPTFVDSEHSNSHKRVLEMRREKGEEWSISRNSTARGSSDGFGGDGSVFD